MEAGILSMTVIAGQGWTGTLGRGSCDLEKMEEKYYSREKKRKPGSHTLELFLVSTVASV